MSVYLESLGWKLKELLQTLTISVGELTRRDKEDIMENYKQDANGVKERVQIRHKLREEKLPIPSGEEWDEGFPIQTF